MQRVEPAESEHPAKSQTPTRVGVVDIGSNAIRVQIAEWSLADACPTTIESHREPIGLGREVFLTGTIPEPMIDATVDVLARFREACDRRGVAHVRAIATSAMRDTVNREEVVRRIADQTNIEVEVISGSEEAYLITLATQRCVDLRDGRSLLVDLGGGSVEVSMVENGKIVFAESFRIGALRVLRALADVDDERESHGDGFFDLLDEYVAAVADRIEEHFGTRDIDRYVATGGNIESIADILGNAHKTVHRSGVEACRLKDVKNLARDLAQMSHAERMAEYGLRKERADTILPAAVVYYRIGRAAAVDRVFTPRVGLKDGLIDEAFAFVRKESRAASHREMLLSACRSLGQRYRYDADHAEIVRHLAVRLFDGTNELHGLGARERSLLEAAALLHDVGGFIGNRGHHKHTAYVIQSSDIVGLDEAARTIVAQVARYHRRAHPGAKHEPWRALQQGDRELVRQLAALLRIADSLDRGHRQKLEDIDVKVAKSDVQVRAQLRPGVDSDMVLERLGIKEKSGLFEDVFGRRLSLEKQPKTERDS